MSRNNESGAISRDSLNPGGLPAISTHTPSSSGHHVGFKLQAYNSIEGKRSSTSHQNQRGAAMANRQPSVTLLQGGSMLQSMDNSKPSNALIKAKKMMRPSTAGGNKQVEFQINDSQSALDTVSSVQNFKGQAEIIKRLHLRKGNGQHNRNLTQVNKHVISVSHLPSSSHSSSRQTTAIQSMKNKNRSTLLMNIEEQLIVEEQNQSRVHQNSPQKQRKSAREGGRRPQTAGTKKYTLLKDFTHQMLSKRMLGSHSSLQTTQVQTSQVRGSSPQDQSKRARQSLKQFSSMNESEEENTVRNIVSAHRTSNTSPTKPILQAPIPQQQQSQVIKDLDEISQSDPLLADLINNKLSIKTDFENSTLDSQLTKLKLVHDQLIELSFGVSREAAMVNSQQYLDKIDRHIKLLQYKLSRVITTMADYHTLLPPNTAVNVDLIECIPIYCKVDTRNRLPPLRLYVDFKDKQTIHVKRSSSLRVRRAVTYAQEKADWKVFVSDKAFEPNEVNAQQVFTNAHRMNIEPKTGLVVKKEHRKSGNNEFMGEYMYISFYSLKGCSVKITAKFPNDDGENENRANQAKKLSRGGQLKKLQLQLRDEIALKVKDIQDNPSGLFELNEEMARIKERQRQRLLGHMATNNFIAQNVQDLDKFEQSKKEEDLQRKMALLNERTLDAQQKREGMDLEALKRKVFLVHKWSIIRERRREHQERMMVWNQRQQRNFSWHTLINTNEIVRTIYTKFNDVRWHIRLNQARNKAASKIQNAVRYWLWRKAHTKSKRLMQSIKQVHNFLVMPKRDTTVAVCKELFRDFLADTGRIEYIKFKFKRYITLIIKVQKDWRSRLEEDRKKLDRLGVMWEKEKALMREFYQTNGGEKKGSPTKKNKLAAGKLLQISDDLKEYMLTKYLKKCKTEFNICFIEYRLDLNPSNFQPSIYKYIEDLKRDLRIFEKELYSGVKSSDPIIDWVSPSMLLERDRAEREPNQDIFSSEGGESVNFGMTSTFTAAVAHASVKKEALSKAQIEEQQKKLIEAQQNAAAAKSSGIKPKPGGSTSALNSTMPPKKPQPLVKTQSTNLGATVGSRSRVVRQQGSKNGEDLDKSFDRKALVDKISQRVEFLYMPTYQNMRRMINKAVRTLAKTAK